MPEPLRASINPETNDALRAMKIRAEKLLTISNGTNQAERIQAIEHIPGELLSLVSV